MSRFDVLVVFLAYLLGSIPFGIVFGKGLRGMDPRLHGSGNIGFTNVLRTSGWMPGVLTLAGDMGKGGIVVFLAQRFSGLPMIPLAAGIGVVLGHNFSAYLGFKGGKGVAPGFGVLLAMDWLVGMIALTIWLFSVAVTRISSVGAIAAFLLLPPIVWWLKDESGFRWFSLLLSVIILMRHRSNFMRLRQGIEPRLGGS
jgi:acyl phosphate:glycerol-3-phosphate acyltransferase